MGVIMKKGVPYCGTSNNANAIKYDNSKSKLNAGNAQDAIDELNSNLNKWTAEKISDDFQLPYTPTQSGLLTLMVMSAAVGEMNFSIWQVNDNADNLKVCRSRIYNTTAGTVTTVTFPVIKDQTYDFEYQTNVDYIIANLYKLG